MITDTGPNAGHMHSLQALRPGYWRRLHSQFYPEFSPPAESSVEAWWDEQNWDPAKSLYSRLTQSSGIDNLTYRPLS